MHAAPSQTRSNYWPLLAHHASQRWQATSLTTFRIPERMITPVGGAAANSGRRTQASSVILVTSKRLTWT